MYNYRLSKLPHCHSLFIPQNVVDLSSNEILSQIQLISTTFAGHVQRHPFLSRIEENLVALGKKISFDQGFMHMDIPTLANKGPLETSGKLNDFGEEFYELSTPNDRFVVSPTTEEPMITFVASGLQSYKQLPMQFSHVHSVFRHVQRPEGFYKTREIRCFVFTTFDQNHDDFINSVEKFRGYCTTLFNALNIQAHEIYDPKSGAIEFLGESENGDRTISSSVVHRHGQNGQIQQDIDQNTKFASLSMGYEFPSTNQFDINFQNPTGSLEKPVVGTFGIGVTRLLGSMFERAKKGVVDAFSHSVRPFDVTLIQAGKGNDKVDEWLDKTARDLCAMGLRVAIDDRSASIGKKIDFSRFFSAPVSVIIGEKGLSADQIEVVYNKTNTKYLHSLAEITNQITQMCHNKN